MENRQEEMLEVEVENGNIKETLLPLSAVHKIIQLLREQEGLPKSKRRSYDVYGYNGLKMGSKGEWGAFDRPKDSKDHILVVGYLPAVEKLLYWFMRRSGPLPTVEATALSNLPAEE